MDENELLTLWHRGLHMAERFCARTLTRLENGDGGFYEADDFLQDLFLVFREMAERWHAGGSADEEALWAAWRRQLRHGGQRILRRAPQRLWRRPEVNFPLEELHDPVDALGVTSTRLSRAIERALTQPEDAEAAQLQAETLTGLAQALQMLPAARRRALQLAAVAEQPSAQVAAELGLDGAPSI